MSSTRQSRGKMRFLAAGLCLLLCACSAAPAAPAQSDPSVPTQSMGSVIKKVDQYSLPSLYGQVEHGPDAPIQWEDEGIEAYIRYLLDKPEGDICRSDVWDIQYFEIQAYSIAVGNKTNSRVTLAALEQPPEGQDTFAFQSILDAGVRTTVEDVAFPSVQSLRDLQYFDSLQVFSYDTDRVEEPLTDFSGVEHCQYLKVFEITNASPQTLEPLASLPQLERLTVSGCGALELAPLEALSQLQALDLSGCAIDSLEPLCHLPQLTVLSLGSSPLTGGLSKVPAFPSLEPLTRSAVQYLDMSTGWGTGDQYKDVDYTPLAAVPGLVWLDLTNHTMVDTDLANQILEGDGSLRYLNLAGTPAAKDKIALHSGNLEILALS